MGRAKFMLLSWLGQRLCYCRGQGKGYVTVVGRANVMLLLLVEQKLRYSRG